MQVCAQECEGEMEVNLCARHRDHGVGVWKLVTLHFYTGTHAALMHTSVHTTFYSQMSSM